MVNPLGAMPMFGALTSHETDERKRQIAKKASFIMVCILVTFYFLGTFIMSFFGISLEAMRIAGGFIIFSSGINLMTGGERAHLTEETLKKSDISFSPLAMPMLSGPGSISLLIAFHAQQQEIWQHAVVIIAVLMVGICTYLVLSLTPIALRALGTEGVSSVSKILGFFIMAIGVQYIINGIYPLLDKL